jgi:hypothetical protein
MCQLGLCPKVRNPPEAGNLCRLLVLRASRQLPLRETLRGRVSGLITHCTRSTLGSNGSCLRRRRRNKSPSMRLTLRRAGRISWPSTIGWRPSVPFVTTAQVVENRLCLFERSNKRCRPGRVPQPRPDSASLYHLGPSSLQVESPPLRTWGTRENPVLPPGKNRLIPQLLLSKSSQGRAVELLARCSGRKVRPGHHHYYSDGRGSDWLSAKLVSRISRVAALPKQDFPAKIGVCPWYYHADNLVNVADRNTHKWCREFLIHGTIWTGACDSTVHQSQRLSVKPLKSTHWPSDSLGPSWPSFPSITEWMEMLRRGLDPFGSRLQPEPVDSPGFTRVDRSELHDNHVLATKIVKHNIVGIRSSVKIPAKFRGYFRYRHNFLILTVRHNLPVGLVRFLLSHWVVSPFSLWLRRAVSLKKFLRKVPTLLVKQAELVKAEYAASAYPSGTRSSTPSQSLETDRSYLFAQGSPFELEEMLSYLERRYTGQ